MSRPIALTGGLLAHVLPLALILFSTGSAAAQPKPPEKTAGNSSTTKSQTNESQVEQGRTDETQSDAAGEEAHVAEPSPEDSRATELRTKKDKALLGYSIGNTDAALTNLQLLVTQCDELGKAVCSNTVRAELYVALAIVMAGGKNDISGGARLFHAALTYDPEVTVPRELATNPVQQAMFEANSSTSFDTLRGGAQPVTEKSTTPRPPIEKDRGTDEPPADVSPNDDEPKSKNRRGFFLANVQGGGGEFDGDSVSMVGAGVTLGILPTDAAWALAIRARGGVLSGGYLGSQGLGGVTSLTGAVWGKDRSKNKFGYVLGGLGLDSYYGEAHVTANGLVGISLGGFLIGGSLETGIGYSSYALAGLHLGWAGRL